MIRASNLLPTAILLVYGCWEHFARQDMVNSQHVSLWPLTNPCIWSGSWLVGVNCTRTILLCAIETQRWVFRMFPAGWLSGTQGNTDYRARCTMQVFWHLMLKQTLRRSTQGHSILISRAQNNFVPPSCFSHVTSLQSMTLNWETCCFSLSLSLLTDLLLCEVFERKYCSQGRFLMLTASKSPLSREYLPIIQTIIMAQSTWPAAENKKL